MYRVHPPTAGHAVRVAESLIVAYRTCRVCRDMMSLPVFKPLQGAMAVKKIVDLLRELHEENDYEASSDFVADGLLDSLDLQRLLAAFETEYGVRVAGTDLVPMNFANLETMRALLADYGVAGDI